MPRAKKQEPAPLGEADPKAPDMEQIPVTEQTPVTEETPVTVEIQEKEELPTVETELAEEEPIKPPTWRVIESLSDEEMEVEAVSVQARQLFKVLLRFRVEGKLTGQVIEIDRLQIGSDQVSGETILISRM